MSIDGDVMYIPGLDIRIGDSDRITAYRQRPTGIYHELPLRSLLMQLRQPYAVDCHWWRLTEPADGAGEIVTITEDSEPDIRGVMPARHRRAFLRQGDQWRRLAQDPNAHYLFQTGHDPASVRVYCAGSMPGWVRNDELTIA